MKIHSRHTDYSKYVAWHGRISFRSEVCDMDRIIREVYMPFVENKGNLRKEIDPDLKTINVLTWFDDDKWDAIVHNEYINPSRFASNRFVSMR